MPAHALSVEIEHLQRLHQEDLDRLERTRQADRALRLDWEASLNRRFEEARRSLALPTGPTAWERLARGLVSVLF